MKVVQKRKEAIETRINSLVNKMSEAENDDNNPVTESIKAILAAERKQRCYNMMKKINKPDMFNGGISHVIVNNGKANVKTQDNDEMNRILVERN